MMIHFLSINMKIKTVSFVFSDTVIRPSAVFSCYFPNYLFCMFCFLPQFGPHFTAMFFLFLFKVIGYLKGDCK